MVLHALRWQGPKALNVLLGAPKEGFRGVDLVAGRCPRNHTFYIRRYPGCQVCFGLLKASSRCVDLVVGRHPLCQAFVLAAVGSSLSRGLRLPTSARIVRRSIGRASSRQASPSAGGQSANVLDVSTSRACPTLLSKLSEPRSLHQTLYMKHMFSIYRQCHCGEANTRI